MLKSFFAVALLFAIGINTAAAQIFETEHEEVIVVNGHKVPVLIKGKDTIIMAALDEVNIISTRLFKNDLEKRRFIQMQYNAKKVLPYAVEAIRLFEDIEADTRDMKAGKKHRRVADVQKELQARFEKPLKGLYKSQGLLLVKMIERGTGRSLYSILSEYKGGLSAFYYNTVGSFYDYDLKKGYNPNDDPMMESVISVYNLRALAAQKRAETKNVPGSN
jgi:Domain of unknown function (DUF4294)